MPIGVDDVAHDQAVPERSDVVTHGKLGCSALLAQHPELR
jgi:hypothetical protein